VRKQKQKQKQSQKVIVNIGNLTRRKDPKIKQRRQVNQNKPSNKPIYIDRPMYIQTPPMMQPQPFQPQPIQPIQRALEKLQVEKLNDNLFSNKIKQDDLQNNDILIPINTKIDENIVDELKEALNDNKIDNTEFNKFDAKLKEQNDMQDAIKKSVNEENKRQRGEGDDYQDGDDYFIDENALSSYSASSKAIQSFDNPVADKARLNNTNIIDLYKEASELKVKYNFRIPDEKMGTPGNIIKKGKRIRLNKNELIEAILNERFGSPSFDLSGPKKK